MVNSSPQKAPSAQRQVIVNTNEGLVTALIFVLNGVLVTLSGFMAVDILQEGDRSIAGLGYLITFPLVLVVLAVLIQQAFRRRPLPRKTRRTRLVAGLVGVVAFALPLIV